MTQEEIIEGNKLIAEFMYPHNTYSTYYIEEHSYLEFKYGNYDYHDTFSVDELKYHSDWSWLMGVISEMNNIEEWNKYEIGDLSIALVSADIRYAFELVVEFIKEYNKQNETKHIS